MHASVRALLTGIIDYAGMFPPANLPLDEALRNYLRYRSEPESWMLGRFICPAARLAELDAYRGLFQEGPPFAFSVLGRGGSTDNEFLAGLRADIADIAAFRARHANRVTVQVLETHHHARNGGSVMDQGDGHRYGQRVLEPTLVGDQNTP